MVYTSRILFELFKFVKGQDDYQEYMIYISFLIELIEKFGVKNYYQLMFQALNSKKSGDIDNIKNIGTFNTLIELSFTYLNLKMLYVKFAFEAKYTKIAEYHCAHIRELLVHMKKDQNGSFLKLFKKKLQFKIVRHVFKRNSSRIDASLLNNASKLQSNEREVEINLFDKFFIYCVNIKATLMKFNLKLK